MGTIESYVLTIRLLTAIVLSCSERQELVLVKFMKGSPEFRESGKCYTQFANEVFVYAELLPAYENLLRDSKLNTELVEQFVPRVYCAKFGLIKGTKFINIFVCFINFAICN